MSDLFNKKKIKFTLIEFNNFYFFNVNSNTYMLAVNVNVISPFASKLICAFTKVILITYELVLKI